MEQLLFFLFVLFMVISALLERRKQHRKREEQQRRVPQRPPPKAAPEEVEEEVGWPFGRDWFEIEFPRSRPGEGQPEPVAPETRESAGMEAEPRPSAVAREGLESRSRRYYVVDRRRIQERETSDQSPLSGSIQVGRWRLDPVRARDAIVYAEILGPPKAERRDEDLPGFAR